MKRRSLALPISVALLALALPGCSVDVAPPDEPAGTSPAPDTADGTSTDTEPAAVEDDATDTTDAADDATDAAAVLPDGATWLFDVPSESGRGSGAQSEAAIAGGPDEALHPNSTAQWLGCEGVPDLTVYELGGSYTQLSGWLALRDGTPEGVVATVDITTDQGVIGRYQVEGDGGTPLQIVLDGIETLTLSAELSSGECASSEESYLVLVDTYVR